MPGNLGLVVMGLTFRHKLCRAFAEGSAFPASCPLLPPAAEGFVDLYDAQELIQTNLRER
jgi:hypothetical protein